MSLELDNELNSLFSQMSASTSTAGLEIPGIEPVSVPTPAPIVTQVTPVVPQAVPAVPKVAIDLDAVQESWDTTPETPVTTNTPVTPVAAPTFDFSALAQELNAPEIKSKEDLVRALNDYKDKAAIAQALPQDLAKAAEIAKLGGNYHEYLGVSAIDWAKEDPIVLYENSITEQWRDPVTGAYNYEESDAYLDSLDERTKVIEGKKLQNHYIQTQARQKADIEAQARYQRSQFESSVRSALDSVDNVNGFKLTASHKADIYNDIVAGKDLERNDVKQRVLNWFKTKNFDKIDSYRRKQIQTAALKEILDEAQVPQLNSSQTTTNTPAVAENPMQAWIGRLEKGGR